jgi:hypothetical protein
MTHLPFKDKLCHLTLLDLSSFNRGSIPVIEESVNPSSIYSVPNSAIGPPQSGLKRWVISSTANRPLFTAAMEHHQPRGPEASPTKYNPSMDVFTGKT